MENATEPARERWQNLARGAWPPGVLLAILTMVVHGWVLGGWWTEDDPQVLQQVIRETAGSILFNAERWRIYSSANFSPWVVLSYQTDFSFAGLEPRFFYLHHLLSLVLAILFFFIFVERFAGRWIAFFASAAVMVSPAAMYAAQTLMTRHYIEGLVFAVAALCCWSGQERWKGWAAAAFYFLAALSKEVYAPLPLLFIVLSLASRESRGSFWRRLAPSALAAAIYLVWRTVMLGSIGGYGPPPSLKSILALPRSLWASMMGPDGIVPGLAWLGIALVSVAGAVRATSLGRVASITALSGAFVLLPLVPIAGSVTSRFTFAPMVVFAALTAAAASLRTRPREQRLLMVAFAAIALFCGLLQCRRVARHYAFMVAEGRYIWSEGASARPLLTKSHGWYLHGLSTLRRMQSGGEAPRTYSSLYGPLLEGVSLASLVEFRSPQQASTLAPESIREADKLAQAARNDQPVEIILTRSEDVLQWQFGPAAQRWLYLTVPLYEAHSMPDAGWYRIPGKAHPPSMLHDPSTRFRIVRETARGWTATPPLSLPSPDRSIQWDNKSGFRAVLPE